MSERTITIDEAEGYLYDSDGHVAIQEVSKHRWYTKQIIVFKDESDDSLWGFYYLDPLSEMQEGMDSFETDPVPIFPVVAKEITATVYEVGAPDVS